MLAQLMLVDVVTSLWLRCTAHTFTESVRLSTESLPIPWTVIS